MSSNNDNNYGKNTNLEATLTIKECAELLKVSPCTVYGLLSTRREPDKIFARKVGRSWRITRQELERFLNTES